jgi:transcriptional regulator with XRE-family HTH domain
MPQKPLPLIINLKRWRAENGFSQSEAVKVLNKAGIPVTLDSLQNWESGRRSPRAGLALALADFLREDPTASKKSGAPTQGALITIGSPSHSTPAVLLRGSPALVHSHGNLDKLPKSPRAVAEFHPSPACRRGNGEALESRASSCIHYIGTPMEQSLTHSPSATNPEMR